MKRKICFRFLGIAATLLPAAASVAADTQSTPCTESDTSAVAERHRQWILNWDRKKPDERWDFDEKFGRFYDYDANDMVLYDDFDPQYRVARSPGEYSAIWSPPFKTLRTAHHVVIDAPDAIVGEDLATSTLEFGARLETADGSIVGIRTRSTLVWRCTNDGWRIVREHNSSRRITEEETQRLFSEVGSDSMRRVPAPKEQTMATHPYVGMWVTDDGNIRHELLPNGRYDEARGRRQSAYQGRYEITGTHIEYWDDAGFTADGDFVDQNTLHHGGMIFRRR